MGKTVDVRIPVDAEVASVLDDEKMRIGMGMLLSRMLQPTSPEQLEEVMDAIALEARRRGLTDEILEAELEAYNSERRGP